MNWTIDFTTEFSRGAKVLKKRYKSFIRRMEGVSPAEFRERVTFSGQSQ